MEYPYIGKGKHSESNVLFIKNKTGIAIDNMGLVAVKGILRGDFKESEFTNITREYLEGKCVKIESPEHGEFIIKLAEVEGFMQYEGDFTGNYKNGDFLFFYGDNDITCAHGNTKGWEEITIPPPPKEEPEPKERPQVGDTVIWGNGADNFKLLVVHKGGAWKPILTIDTEIIPVSELKKSKTQAEILRDNLTDLIMLARDADASDEIIANSILSKYNMTKKPQ